MVDRPLRVWLIGLAFATSGILVTPGLPGLGTKLALPDLPLVLLILGTGFYLLRGPIVISRDTMWILILAAAFIGQSILSHLINGLTGRFALAGLIETVNYLYGFLIMVSVVAAVRHLGHLRFCLRAWIWGGLIVCLVALWGLIGGAPDWVYDGRRISATLRGVNQMQSYLMPVLLAAFLLLLSRDEGGSFRVACVMVIPIAVLALLSTGSRSTLILLVVLGGILFYANLAVFKSRPVLSMLLLGAFGLAALGLSVLVSSVLTYGSSVLPEALRAIARPILLFREMMALDDAAEALGPRGAQLEAVAQLWWREPVWGIGPGNFKDSFDSTREVHNTYAGVLLQNGIPGLGLLLAMKIVPMILLARRIGGQETEVRLIGYLLLGIGGLLLLYGAATFGLRQRVFWLWLGLVTALIDILEAPMVQRAALSARREVA